MARVGGTRRRPLLAAVMALALWAPAPSAVELPDLGTSADRVMSPADEARIGAEFFRSLRQHVELVEDPELQAYIRNLGYRLASYSGASTDFHFFIVRDPRINAFAAPGGYVGFNAGLILEARDESELAGVVAHEIAHVQHRDALGSYGNYGRVVLPFNWWFMIASPWLLALDVAVVAAAAGVAVAPLAGVGVLAALGAFVALGSRERLGPLSPLYSLFDTQVSLFRASIELLRGNGDGTWEVDEELREAFEN